MPLSVFSRGITFAWGLVCDCETAIAAMNKAPVAMKIVSRISMNTAFLVQRSYKKEGNALHSFLRSPLSGKILRPFREICQCVASTT
jgi:hypothetical protein